MKNIRASVSPLTWFLIGIIPVVTVYLIVLSSSLISCLVTTGGSSGTGASAGVAAGCAAGGTFGGLCCGACCANERRIGANSNARDSSVDLNKLASSSFRIAAYGGQIG